MMESTFDTEQLPCLGHDDLKDASTKGDILNTKLET